MELLEVEEVQFGVHTRARWQPLPILITCAEPYSL